jgi:hypothetical protein
LSSSLLSNHITLKIWPNHDARNIVLASGYFLDKKYDSINQAILYIFRFPFKRGVPK